MQSQVEFDNDDMLLCPMCKHDHTHLVEVRGHSGGHAERLDADLRFTCEQGCEFTLKFHQLRGQTEVWPVGNKA